MWRQATKYKVPRIGFVNKMDRAGADFLNCVGQMKERLNANPVPLQLPIGAEANFVGIIDLITMKANIYDGKSANGEKFDIVDIPDECRELADEYREKLVEAAADIDNSIMEKFLGGEEVSSEEITAAVRKGALELKMTPILCGAAFKNKGVQQLLDAVVTILPSPLDVPPIQGTHPDTEKEITRKSENSEPLSALAFKIMTDPFVGQLAFVRVYSGELKSGSYVYNSTTNQRERVGRLLRMHSNKREEITYVGPGDIGAVIGLKKTFTGDTLCLQEEPVILESIVFPEPVISVAIEPKTKAEQDKLSDAMVKLLQEDPTFRVKVDAETNQTVISGMGELHLDILVDRMRREFSLDVNVSQPQVAYKETIRKAVEHKLRYAKQSGGRGQFAELEIKVEPSENGVPFKFIDKIRGGAIPKEFIPAVEKGVKEAMERGILCGYNLVDAQVTLLDGAFHEVDSSEMAFKIAASMAFKEAALKASPVLLEPIMEVEVVTPEEFMGDVIGNVNAKRGKIKEMTDRAGAKVIRAKVPLSGMFGYSTDLRSMSQGRANFTMEFAKYEAVPSMVAEELIAKATGNKKLEVEV